MRTLDILKLDDRDELFYPDEFMSCGGNWMKSSLPYEMHYLVRINIDSSIWEYCLFQDDGKHTLLRKKKSDE